MSRKKSSSKNEKVEHDLGTASFYIESLSAALNGPEIDVAYCQELVRALSLKVQTSIVTLSTDVDETSETL